MPHTYSHNHIHENVYDMSSQRSRRAMEMAIRNYEGTFHRYCEECTFAIVIKCMKCSNTATYLSFDGSASVIQSSFSTVLPQQQHLPLKELVAEAVEFLRREGCVVVVLVRYGLDEIEE